MSQITTKRLFLRPAQIPDVAALFDVYRREEAMRYWDTLPHDNPAQTEGLVNGMLRSAEQTYYFVVEHLGRVVGTAGFWQASEVGYILHPDLWGQGLGREVLGALVQFGFEDCQCTCITAEVDPQNVASIRMLFGAGFHETGRATNTIQIGGKWFDSIYFRLEREAST